MRPYRFDLTGDLRIERGSEWRRRTFAIEGDFTSWQIFGQIRNKAGGVLYANFSFEPLILISLTIEGVNKECTRIIPFLTASAALAVPVTKTTTGPIIVGRHRWEYDIKIKNPLNSEQIFTVFEGLAESSDTVTVIL